MIAHINRFKKSVSSILCLGIIVFSLTFSLNFAYAQNDEMRGGVNFHLDPWAKLTNIQLDSHFQFLRENKIQ